MQFARQILAANNHTRVSVNCHCVLHVNMVLEFHNEKFLSFDLHNVWKNCQTVALNILCLTVFALMLIEASGHLVFLPANHKDTWQLLSFCGHKRQIMQHVRNKSELAFAIASTQRKRISEYVKLNTCAFPCKSDGYKKGANDDTCTNPAEYVPTCHSVYMKVSAYDF